MRNCFNIEFVHYAYNSYTQGHLLLEMCQNVGKSDELPL